MQNRPERRSRTRGKELVLLAFVVMIISVAGAMVSRAMLKGWLRGGVRNQNTESIAVKTRAEELLEQMSLQEKCAQLFVVRLNAFGLGTNSETLSEAASQALKESGAGGVVLFGGNIGTPEQLKKLVDDIKMASSTPLFIALDEEGGSVSRIGNNPAFQVEKIPTAGEIGNTNDTKVAERAARAMADYLKTYGFNVDFAPVADVNSNSENMVIGARAFGSNPQEVAEMVEAQIRAFTGAGVISVAKHFPGHGDTAEDTHLGTAVASKNLEELEAAELIPFRAAIMAGVPMIMVTHITLPNIDNSGLPATLSETVMTRMLREKLGYSGVIITDAMEMGAISRYFSSGDAAVKALKAGADIILMPEDFNTALDGVVEAVRSGEIDEEALDEKVLRVLMLKERFGIL